MSKGACLCGAVRFKFDETLVRGSDACHCSQCRKHTGHYFASVDVPKAAISITGEESISWYRSSEKVRRGFCRECGSSLFWDPDKTEHEFIAVAMGALETPTGLRLAKHIFVADKGDYYDIADGLPQQ